MDWFLYDRNLRERVNQFRKKAPSEMFLHVPWHGSLSMLFMFCLKMSGEILKNLVEHSTYFMSLVFFYNP